MSTQKDIEHRFTEIIDQLSNISYGLSQNSSPEHARAMSYRLECLVEEVKAAEQAVTKAISPVYFDPHP